MSKSSLWQQQFQNLNKKLYLLILLNRLGIESANIPKVLGIK